MQQGGQNDNDDEDDLLRLVPEVTAAKKRAGKPSGQREQVQHRLRHAPGSVFLALMFVVAIEDERHDAETEKPAGIERQSPPSEVQQASRYACRDKEEKDNRVTLLKRRPARRLIFCSVLMLCTVIQNLHRFLCLSSCLSPRPALL